MIAPRFAPDPPITMIQPHGAAELKPLFVFDKARHAALVKEAAGLPSLLLNSAAAANAVMLGGGYFTPLAGYMNLSDAMSVARDMKTVSGLFWPVPIVNLTRQSGPAAEGRTKPWSPGRLALKDPNVEGNPVIAVMDVKAVETVSDADLKLMAEKIFGTLDPKHPGVGTFLGLGNTLLSGPIEVLNFSYFEKEFPETFRTAVQIRDEIGQRGWKKVVAFQTRNPMHRAHEELCHMAMERLKADGLVIHMLLGKLKEGDIPAPVRDASIRKMVELYFKPNSAMVYGYGFDMLYAGPREALLHAVFRQNMGATHLIVGRDHAGVGSYYGPFDAQTVFEQVPKGALKIEIFGADNTAWSKKLDRVVMMREAPGHTPEDFINLSGTKVREMLGKGMDLPPEFSRPEVAKILMDYYQSIGG
jgi:sulfate adenylyltransferase